MRPRVAQLDGQSVFQSIASESGIAVEEGGKAPEHRIAIPIGGGDVITRATRGDADELLRVYGAAPCIELGEEEVAVHEQVEIGLARGARPRGEECCCLLDHGFGATAFDLFAKRASVVSSAEFFDASRENEIRFDGFSR